MSRRPAMVHLLFIVALAASGAGLYFAAPWLLPVRIFEGPYVQAPSTRGATLIWYLTRAADCTLETSNAGLWSAVAVSADGRRCRAEISGAAPGARVEYRIRAGGRTLASAMLQTNKAAGETFEFLVFGDSGRGTREQYALARLMADDHPDLVVHTGDLIYADGQRRRYEPRFFLPYRALIESVAFWPSVGNHDATDADARAAYASVFELPLNGPADQPPEANYWFDYADARFIIIDSNVSQRVMEQSIAPWVRRVLEDAPVRWKFAVMHHPPRTVGSHMPDEGVLGRLVPAFEDCGVDIVFSGHDHMYQRWHCIDDGQVVPDGQGPMYVVTGAGGAKLYDTRPRKLWPPGIAAVENHVHSYTRLSVSPDALRLEQIAIDGRTLDTFELHKAEKAQNR